MTPEARQAVLDLQVAAARADWARLKKADKAAVTREFHAGRMVASSVGASKTDLICSILDARYGRKVLAAAF